MHLPMSAAPATIIHNNVERRVLIHHSGQDQSAENLWLDSAEDIFADGDHVRWPSKRLARKGAVSQVAKLTRAFGLVRFTLVPVSGIPG